VHGVGDQAPGDATRKLVHGLALASGTGEPAAGAVGEPVDMEVAGIPLRLYEVYWADLLRGEIAQDTFSGAEFQAFAWFPWLNHRSGIYPRGKYSMARVLGWGLVLPVLGLLMALPYYGLRLIVPVFDRDYRQRMRGEKPPRGLRAAWRNAQQLADSAAHQRTILEDTIDEYAGDVFNYVNSAGEARFPEGREKDVPDAVQSAYHAIADRFRSQLLRAARECGEVQVLAHSLGTVISFHGLFGLCQSGLPPAANAEQEPELEAARQKVTRLYTIGSPLEKIGFFWPKLLHTKVAPGNRTLQWENFVSWFDPVAGVLKHFDQWGPVRNQRLLGGGFVTGHVVYEQHPRFLDRFLAGLGAGPVQLQRGLGQRFRTWLLLLGETLLAPTLLGVITLAGGMLWLAVAMLFPWIAKLLFLPEFMPQIDPEIFDRIGLGFGAIMTLVLLINSRRDAGRIHSAAWSARATDDD
jgi:hypothetical protein